MKVIFAICTLALTGCSANWHLKRALVKNPALLTEGVVVQTVTDTIEVVIPELRVDTLHEWSVDTVTTYVDRVRIRTKVDTMERTVYVDVVCPADTVYVEHTTERTVIQPTVRKGVDWRWLLLVVALGVIGWLSRPR